MYTYKAEVIRVIDGDTVVLNIDLGFKIHHITPCRLAGINAPEMNSKDEKVRAAAVASKEYLIGLLPEDMEVTIVSKKLDKYGRPVVDFLPHYTNEIYRVNELMIKSGHATIYKD
jgi:micrococcal nuclease